ncbi:MAG: DUF4114 domain-containing protein [Candidatus Kaiserbacteria bacterium]|nr:DUF4114 domain-containing protein [Candidatus Kaiserbacteria bacterium]MCB9815924.1 DUF4114 domain-containing protein [Candidatus Nomurabacteria bacterium]
MNNSFIFSRRTITARVYAIVTIVSLLLSAFPASFFVAEAAVGPTIEPQEEPVTVFVTGEEVPFTADDNGFADGQTVYVSLASSNGGVFSTGNNGGACTSDFDKTSITIASNKSTASFCYKNDTAGSDTITATFSSDGETDVIVTYDVTLVTAPGYFCKAEGNEGFHKQTLNPAEAQELHDGDDAGLIGPGVNEHNIIPPFGDFPGYNWDAAGEAIFGNDCVEPVVIDVCPNIDGPQSEVPADHHIDQAGNCVEDQQPPEKVDNTCLLPDGDFEAFTRGPILYPAEDTLEEIFAAAGYGSVDVDNEQMSTETWSLESLDTDTVTLKVTVLGKQAGNTQTFGYYAAGNTGSFVSLLSVPTAVVGDSVEVEIPGQTIGFGLMTVGNPSGSWYSEFDLNSGDQDNLAVYNPEENVYLLAFEDRPESHEGYDNDHNDLVLKVEVLECTEGPGECVPERYVFADNVGSSNQGLTKGGAAVAVNRSNPEDATGDPDWTSGGSTGFYSLGFGGWIIVSFDKYVVNVEGNDLSIHEATNGTYPLEKARVEVSQNGSEWHVLSEEAHNDSSEGGDGVTLLDFDETGLSWIKYVLITDTTDPSLHGNDADGFDLDTVDATYVVCDEPEPDPEMIAIHTYKVVCTDEADLPNWNTVQNGAPTITGNTAADWVAEHDSCRLVEGWQFQWAPYGTSNPGDALYGAAGGNWSTPFTGTTNILLSDLNDQNKLWMREVLEEDYIPFTFASEGSKNINDVTAEFYCHLDGLNYDNYDRIDGVEADGEYYCVAWNAPVEPDVEFGPYCGDGVVQGWEQCDEGSATDTCTAYCTNQCTDNLQLVKITLDPQAPESDSFDGMIYLGSESNPIPNGTWFNFAEVGDAAANHTALAATGLAVERTATDLVLAVEGGNANNHFDYVFGSIETLGIDLGAADRSPITGWPLENTGSYVDVFDVDEDTDSVDFKFWLTTGDDAASVAVNAGEAFDCPECNAEVEARIVLQDGEEIMNGGEGNLLPQVILGDGSTVPFGEWFKLSEANPGPSATWIDDAETVTNYPSPADLDGLFVSREGNGQVKVALYGFHNPGGDVNYESLRATIEFNDASVASAAQIPGDFKLENHPEDDLVLSNDNFDSFAVAGDSMSVDFDFWVDTAADGITITLDEDSVATCDEDTDPKDPEPDTFIIDGKKYGVDGEIATGLAGWTINLTDGDEIIMSTTTDETGYYYFVVEEGYYEVHEAMQTDWVQVEVDENGYPVDTDSDLEHCSFEVYEYDYLYARVTEQLVQVAPNGYDCDFYNEYVGDDEPEDVLGCTDPDALNYVENATLGNKDAENCNYSDDGDNEEEPGDQTGTRTRRPAPEGQVLGATTQCPFLEDYMQIGWENDPWEVTKLQLFLSAFRSLFGGGEQPVTGVFDRTTDANVKAFQEYFRSEVLDPWYVKGIVPHDQPTGFVYKTTRWKINDIICPGWEAYPSFDGENLQSNVDID